MNLTALHRIDRCESTFLYPDTSIITDCNYSMTKGPVEEPNLGAGLASLPIKISTA